ncbi:zinc finger MIZ domain-containing protein 1-like isoform X2 [Tubulanus polymorphus]|uniref:zinc finger MIZ domain-containing protein 1-like isoform X2 n=1 Tax=Tubulanus polymorphus TaxID=672921 RepID=UPI003DA3852B
MNDMDRHIQQTNDRLLCIKQHLATPHGFQNAARELLEWCSDARAFQKPFEETLISCLTVVSRVAAQPGYDLDLGYRLLAVCAAHRDKFSSKSAAMLSLWCEDLGRLLLLRHQKNRNSDSSKTSGNMHAPMQNKMPPMPQGDWQGGGPGPGQQQSLSVVTTVWGVTSSTNSGPFNHAPPNAAYTNTTMANNGGNYGPQPPQNIPSNNQLQKPPYNPQMQMPPGGYRPREAAPYSRPISRGSYHPPTPPTPRSNQAHPNPAEMVNNDVTSRSRTNHGGYTPTPNAPPGSNMPPHPQQMVGGSNDFQPPPGALSAAAMVAAAATATATATATASMVALQEQHNQQQINVNMNMNMNNQYGAQMQGQQVPPNAQYHHSQRPPGPMNMGQGPGPMKGNMMFQQRRPSPYPNHQQYLHQKRQHSSYMNGQYGPGPGSHPQYANQGQYGPRPQYPPTQQPLPSPTYGPGPGQPNRPPGPPGYGGAPNPYMNQGQFPPRQPGPAYNQPNYQNNMNGMPNSMNMNMNNMNYQHSPIPGNPTPPMTPSSGMPPYMSPGPDIKPNFQDIKPNVGNMPPMKKENDELRLTFPVRDGVVLPPFRLEHNLAVSNHVFHLRDSVYQTLMWRSDLELQLKCFHHEDRQMNTNWPASVTVSVNATPLNIERGENKTSHKPLYLKDVCQPGRNTIQITVTACCCSHLFVLQLVHRPSVRSVLQGLLRKRLLPAEHCITKIKRNFTSPANGSMNGSDDGVEQTAIKVSLKCPITFRRISLPARGQDCKHIQCFDLESYLQLNCERGAWRCPVCNKTALLEGLEIDQYIWGILTNLSQTEFEEVTIDPTASWKPVQIKTSSTTIKEEDTGEASSCNGNGNRWMKAMSPSSMQMPTMNSWAGMGPVRSPYSMPPVSITPQGPGGPPNSAPGGPQQGANNPYGFPDQNPYHNAMSPEFHGPLSHISDSINSPGEMPAISNHLEQYGPVTTASSNQPQQPPQQTQQQQQSMPLRHPDQPGSNNPPSNQPPTPNSQPNSNYNMNHNSVQHNTPGGSSGADSNPGSNNPGSNHNTNNSDLTSLANSVSNSISSAVDSSNLLPFDPAAIIDGDTQGQDGLDLLPENIGDPIELLSYLGPPESNGVDGNGNGNNTGATDDLLSLFES